MERHFDEELRLLKEKLLKMASLVEEAISRSMKSLIERSAEIAESVIKAEEEINMLEIEVDETCLKLLALYQPAGPDLRFITSAMKINNDLERMGDLAVNIVQRSVDILKQPQLKPLIDIPQMAKLAQYMVHDSLTAFINKDADLAREVCRRDDEVDKLNDQVFRELLTYMMQDAKNITRAVDLMLVGRHLERIADHATNISEDVVYYVKGITIKHHIEEKKKET